MKRPILVAVVVLGLAGLAPTASAAPAPTVTLSDRTDLVHGQEILVQGRNWDPQLFGVTTAVCADPVDDDRCEQIGYQRVSSNGRFGMHAVVDAYLDLFDTPPVDCRVETCWLVVRGHGYPNEPAPIVRTATFDPNGPGPSRRPVDVSPNVGLVDGSLLTVQGEGFTGGGIPREVAMVPCRLPMVVHADCDGADQVSVRIARDGLLDTTFRMDAVLELEDGPWDCRLDACGLLVLDGGSWEEPLEDFSEAGLAELQFDADAPLRAAPSGTATPSTDLVDDQPVLVEATGFDPGERIRFRECVMPVEEGYDPDRCHADDIGTFTPTDGDGAVHRRFSVITSPIDYFDPYDCRVEACAIVLIQTSPYRRLELPIQFDAEMPELDPQVTIEPTQGLHHGQVVTVHGTGFRAWKHLRLFECPPNRYLEPYGCAHRQRVWTGAPDGGDSGNEFTTTYRIRRRVGERDCTVRRCVLYVISGETIPDEVEVALRFG